MTNELQIICLGSGSSGNCYLLGKGDEFIMVECGLPFKTIIKRMASYDIGLEQIKAVCISHCHKDHALEIDTFKNLNLPVFAPYIDDVPIEKPVRLTDWMQVFAFKVFHDVPCYAFIFYTSDNESLLFATDTRHLDSIYLDKRFKYNYIMIECNHIRKQLEAIMDKALMEGDEGRVFKFKRQASFHLSLYGVKKTLRSMDLSETKAIFLLHLSKDCCNDALVKNEVEYATKIKTFVCYSEGRIN